MRQSLARLSRGDLPSTPARRQTLMVIDAVLIQPLVALIAGILILIVPRILNYVVAIYLILVGVLGIWPGLLGGGG
jgi:hypothetical protein